jgi:hypothetical protein
MKEQQAGALTGGHEVAELVEEDLAPVLGVEALGLLARERALHLPHDREALLLDHLQYAASSATDHCVGLDHGQRPVRQRHLGDALQATQKQVGESDPKPWMQYASYSCKWASCVRWMVDL